jgi:hypothetical protein
VQLSVFERDVGRRFAMMYVYDAVLLLLLLLLLLTLQPQTVKAASTASSCSGDCWGCDTARRFDELPASSPSEGEVTRGQLAADLNGSSNSCKHNCKATSANCTLEGFAEQRRVYRAASAAANT